MTKSVKLVQIALDNNGSEKCISHIEEAKNAFRKILLLVLLVPSTVVKGSVRFALSIQIHAVCVN